MDWHSSSAMEGRVVAGGLWIEASAGWPIVSSTQPLTEVLDVVKVRIATLGDEGSRR